jgi:hypothetical protein
MQSTPSIPADGAAGSVAGFSYGDLALRVVARRLEALDWLEEFLSPSFRVGCGEPYAATVTLLEDGQRYDAMAADWSADHAVEMDCFINDSHVVRLPSVASTAHVTIAFQESLSAFYSVDRRARSVTIVSRGGTAAARTVLMRVVRELAMNHSQLGGGTFFHAAACAVAGRALLIAGEKHAGKTTVLLYLLRERGVDFLSNDRVLLPSLNAPTVRSMPTIVTLRAPTLAFFPELSAGIVARRHTYPRTLREAAQDDREVRPGRDGSRSVSPAQLCAQLGVRAVAEAVPQVLLVPRITGETNAGRLRDLAPAEAAACLRRALLSAGIAKKTSDLVGFPDDPPPPTAEQLEEVVQSFAARVRCVECRLGTRAYESSALAGECLALLAESV